MQFPPIKADRSLLWIALQPDATTAERAEALRAVLAQCRLHPLDATPAAELVIVETTAFQARRAAVQAALGAGDRLHLISTLGGRLVVEAISGPATGGPPAGVPPGDHVGSERAD